MEDFEIDSAVEDMQLMDIDAEVGIAATIDAQGGHREALLNLCDGSWTPTAHEFAAVARVLANELVASLAMAGDIIGG